MSIPRTASAFLLLGLLGGLAGGSTLPARAEVVSLTVGINSTCPYGLMG
ncbi:MAG TPA: hypothetical protein VFB38_20915 [Chthonomonadaceae bacterium]|nr:hypothetical protein [Chthonomonadaceae bacterium]